MSDRYGVTKVFLATDDTTALAELRAMLPDHEFVSIANYDR